MRFTLLLLFFLLTGCASVKERGIPIPGSADWLEQVDIAAKIQDNNTVGTEIGSHEWMQAIGHQYGLVDGDGHGPDLGSNEWINALHYKVFNRQLFATADKVYISIDGERLAVFFDKSSTVATIIFAGRKVMLPQSVAASGVRFNQDENEIFWVKGRAATYWKQGKKIFEGAEECR